MIALLPLLWAFVLVVSPIFVSGVEAEELNVEMETDRPDFTEGTSAITPGHVQIEMGYTFTYDGQNERREHVLPEALFRVGLLDGLELRVAEEGWIHEESSNEEDIEGVLDLGVGIKHEMYKQQGRFPSLSFILESSLPTGGSKVSADDLQPELKILWAYDLTTDTSLGGNLNFSSPVEDDERYFEGAASLVLGYGFTPCVGGYLEYFGFYPNHDAPDSISTHYANGGFTYAVTRDIQLDIRMGVGLNDQADDLFFGTGLAVRL